MAADGGGWRSGGHGHGGGDECSGGHGGSPTPSSSSPSVAPPTCGVGLLVVHFVFVATGVFSTCVSQFVYYQGGADHRTMLLPLSNYLGMLVAGLLPPWLVCEPGNGDSHHEREKGHSKEETRCEPRVPAAVVHGSVVREEAAHLTDRSTKIHPKKMGGGSFAPELENEAEALLLSGEGRDDGDGGESSSADAASTSDHSAASDISIPPCFSWVTPNRCIALIVLTDFTGTLLSMVGLTMAGSGLYQVVYSSVVCWSAILSKQLLNKGMTFRMWVGVGMVTFGLLFSAMGQNTVNPEKLTAVFMGIGLTLAGAICFALNYVLTELCTHLTAEEGGVNARYMCERVGATCTGVIAVYMLLYTLPNWDRLVTKRVERVHGSSVYIMVGLASIVVSQAGHAFTYFVLLSRSGAVGTGIMQTLRAVTVFGVSSLLYCHRQESQCYTLQRGIATFIVVIGVVFYSWAKQSQLTAKAGKTKKKEPATPRRKKSLHHSSGTASPRKLVPV